MITSPNAGLFFLAMTIVGCVNNNTESKDSVQKNDQTISESLTHYKMIEIETVNCPAFFHKGRMVLEVYDNSIALVSVRSVQSQDAVIKCRNQVLYVCNLPNFSKAIGDTVYITGKSYHIRGDERFPGFPTLLTKIFIKRE